MAQDLPTRARVVVVGGGIVGASVAYHLTALGWTDLVLLEQGRLSGGTTWHAAGLVGQLRATESGTRLVQYSASLYERLEEETGLGTGFKRCGGVTVARTPDRMVQLQRTAAAAEAYDLECELISPERAKELYPVLETEDLLGALWLPGDGTAFRWGRLTREPDYEVWPAVHLELETVAYFQGCAARATPVERFVCLREGQRAEPFKDCAVGFFGQS